MVTSSTRSCPRGSAAEGSSVIVAAEGSGPRKGTADETLAPAIVGSMLWILLVLAVSVVIGLLRGGKLRNLTEIRVRSWWLLIVGFGIQIVAGFLPVERHSLAVGLVLASYLPLLLFVWLNRSFAGMWIAGIGILMNFTVIAVNAGMPVSTEAVVMAGGGSELVLGAKHVLLDQSTRLPFLADILPLPGSVISLGDVFLAIGVGVFLEDQLRQPVRLFAHRVQGEPGSAARRT